MRYYVVYHESITQYGITNKGYYVSYKDKLEDRYSESFIDAKRYKILGPALSRKGIQFSDYGAVETIREINTLIEKSIKIQRIDKLRKLDNKEELSFERKLELADPIVKGIEIVEVNGNSIENLGNITNKEVYDFIKPKADKFKAKHKITDDAEIPLRDSTPEEIDDFLNAF